MKLLYVLTIIYVKNHFQLDYNRTEDRITMTSTMTIAYRMHRNRMFQHYSVFNSKEEALEHLYSNMNKEEWTRVCDLFASEEFQVKHFYSILNVYFILLLIVVTTVNVQCRGGVQSTRRIELSWRLYTHRERGLSNARECC